MLHFLCHDHLSPLRIPDDDHASGPGRIPITGFFMRGMPKNLELSTRTDEKMESKALPLRHLNNCRGNPTRNGS